jgi:hypothetical protein
MEFTIDDIYLFYRISKEFPMFVLRNLALAAQNSNIVSNGTTLAPGQIINGSSLMVTGGSHYKQFTLNALPNAKVNFITYKVPSNGLASGNILIKRIGTKISIKRIGAL